MYKEECITFFFLAALSVDKGPRFYSFTAHTLPPSSWTVCGPSQYVHTYQQKMKDSLRRQGHNFKQPLENTIIFSNHLILLSDSEVKYSIKNTPPCLEVSKPLRFD